MFLKFAYVAFAAIIGGFMFTSCGDDDDNDGGNNNGGKIDPNTIAPNNLVAFFNFEGNGNDQKGGLTPVKEVKSSYPEGRRGKAYQGTGSAGSAGVMGELSCLRYNLPENSKISTLKAFSVSMWVKMQATTDGGPEPMIFQVDGTTDWTWGNFFMLQHRNSVPVDTITVDTYFWKDDAVKNAADPDVWKGQRVASKLANMANNWKHVIVTYDNVASKFCLYIDGAKFAGGTGYEDRKQSETGAPLGDLKFNAPKTFTIGAWADVAKDTNPETWDWAGSFKGMLDEFRIYDRALSADEAKKLYTAEATQIND